MYTIKQNDPTPTNLMQVPWGLEVSNGTDQAWGKSGPLRACGLDRSELKLLMGRVEDRGGVLNR